MKRTLLGILFSLTLMGTALAQTYTVRSGDTLSSIATRYGVTVAALRAENGISGNLILVANTPWSGGTP